MIFTLRRAAFVPDLAEPRRFSSLLLILLRASAITR
jgi:hypothetical protein